MLLYREMDEKKKSGSSIYSMKESNELSNCEKTWVNHKSTFLIEWNQFEKVTYYMI